MIYLDNAATTKPCREAIEAQNYANEVFFNPSALYLPALKIENQIAKVRQNILAKFSLTSTHNVIFTSGATEANNMAILQGARFKGKTILVGKGEHPSVYTTAKNCDGMKCEEITLIKDGSVDLADLQKKLTSDVVLCSIMWVNNETGAINDIEAASKIVKNFDSKIIFHCDAVQGFCKLQNAIPTRVDLISISAHKIGGLKGTGALIYNNRLNLKPLIKGGGQEFDLRSGTLNVGGIFALGAALGQNHTLGGIKEINAYTRDLLSQKIDRIQFNSNGSPFILSASIEGVRSEVVVRMLEQNEIYVSNGSACSSRHADSRILFGMGVSKNLTEGTIRISFCAENTKAEIDVFAACLAKIIKEIRK